MLKLYKSTYKYVLGVFLKFKVHVEKLLVSLKVGKWGSISVSVCGNFLSLILISVHWSWFLFFGLSVLYFLHCVCDLMAQFQLSKRNRIIKLLPAHIDRLWKENGYLLSHSCGCYVIMVFPSLSLCGYSCLSLG